MAWGCLASWSMRSSLEISSIFGFVMFKRHALGMAVVRADFEAARVFVVLIGVVVTKSFYVMSCTACTVAVFFLRSGVSVGSSLET